MSPLVLPRADVLAAAAAPWTGHDTRLIVMVAIAIGVIISLIAVLDFHPFVALIAGSVVLGIGSGTELSKVVDSFSTGMGATLGSTGALIALGAILGKLLADSGGVDRIVDTIGSRSGPRLLPWSMALIAAVIGLPMFFEVGLVLLVPIIVVMAKRTNTPLVLLAVPALAGLGTMHAFVPPHPGPLVAVSALNADVGTTLGLGLLAAIPTVIVAGPLYGKFISRHVRSEAPAELVASLVKEADRAREGGAARRLPSFTASVGAVALPVVLMLAKSIVDIAFPGDAWYNHLLDFLGTPLVAMFIAVLVAMVVFGFRLGRNRAEVRTTVSAGLPAVAGILLVVGAGGGFKQLIVDTGVADAIGKFAAEAHMPLLVLGWLLAVLIRLATGSATVATTAAAGIMAPMVAGTPPVEASLIALAVGAGSLFFSHVNDAGFWLAKEYFGMSVSQNIKTWSVLSTIVAVLGLAMSLLMYAVFV
ncbi:GntP family permease [Streptomyces sp. NBC_01724]|uniref:GntT/GntP/DsdX family permease n=1 Tax=unclassified Streptomyces TaxID=2593676 RepID=UPI002E37B73D|nr:gluconate:H+ symporter [Streptomyces sp. NBC_01724]WTE55083.1 GntP family permease [Streptomyces sp. NBC_01620]WTE63157.1 GntP family permease [Streptomyces sp. NBC_01617]